MKQQSHSSRSLPAGNGKSCFLGTLAGIAIIGILIRVYYIHRKGICYWDEGIFFMGSKFLRWRLSCLWLDFLNHLGFSFSVPDPKAYIGYPVFLQKPFHIILLTLTSLFTGPKIWMVFFHSILFGTACIVLTGWLGYRLYGALAGSVAALWLAIEPYHVHYSRLGLHETDSMFLLLLGYSIWFFSRNRNGILSMFFTGLILQFAFGTSYRLGLLIVLILIFEVSDTVKHGFKNTAIRLALFLSGAVAALLILDLAYHLAFHPRYLWSEPGSYFSLLKFKFFQLKEGGLELKFLDFYLRMFGQFDGWISPVTLLLSSLWLCIKGSGNKRMTGFLFLIPFIVFSVMSPKLARTITGILPWGALAVGICFQDIWRNREIRRSKWLPYSVIAIGIGIIFSLSAKLAPIYQIRSGYTEIVDYLQKNNVTYHLSTMKPVFAAYMGNHSVDSPGFTLEELHRQVQKTGVRYLTVDWQKYLRYPQSVMRIEETVLPVFAAQNPVGLFFSTLHENQLPGDVPVLRHIDPTLGFIKVYDLFTALPLLGYPLNTSR